MFKVSVIVTTYNDSEFLKNSMRSVCEQSYSAFELIVIDDGSKNNDAKDIVLAFSVNSKMPVHYFYKNNGGPSSARNFGVKMSSGNYIAFLDADDVWLPNNLSHKIQVLSKCNSKENIFGIYGSFIFSDSMITQQFSSIELTDLHKNLPDKVGKKNGIPGGLPSYIINKSAYITVGGFDEELTINEDFDLIIRFLSKGYAVCGDSHPGFIRTMRDESLTRNKNYLLTYTRIANFLKKADEMNYFSKLELKKRRYNAAFSTAKKILGVKFYDLNGVKLLLIGFLIALSLK